MPLSFLLSYNNSSSVPQVKRGEALQKSQDAEEEVVEQLMRAVEEVDEKQRAVAGEGDFVELLQKFPVMSSHKAPKGYGHARVVLDAAEAVMLSFCGEEELENDARIRDSNRSFRSHSLSDGTRRRTSSRQIVRSRSLLHTKGKPEHLLDSGEASDIVASRASTPTSRRSGLVSDVNDVYEVEVSLTAPSVAVSTPQFPRSRKTVNKNKDIAQSVLPTTSQDNERDRRRVSDVEDLRAVRQRGRGPRRRRRRGDREGESSGHRRGGVHSLCSLM